MKPLTINTYQFDELDDAAKEKAREWYREISAHDSFWSECVIDDAKEYLTLLGFKVEHVYFSGFWSQGDGACFVGTWYASQLDREKIRTEYPTSWTDKRTGETVELKDNVFLQSVADELADIAKRCPDARAQIVHRGHYYHEMSVNFSNEGFERETKDGEVVACMTDEANFVDFARDLMRFVYRHLEEEYNYQNSDEAVDEALRVNEYSFTQHGLRRMSL